MTDPKAFVQQHEQVIHDLFARIDTSTDALVEKIRTICEIPAPTFEEEKRTRYMMEQLPALGLKDVHALGRGSVLGYTRGRAEGDTLVVAAHIDTVFPASTDVSTRIEGNLLYGPSIGDNSASVGATLELFRLLGECGIRPARNVAVAGTIGEEGKGSLGGIREVLDELGDRVAEVIAVDGTLASVVNRSLAIRRYEVTIHAPGGHSWAAFGAQSAVHTMGRIVAAVADLEVPADPRTTFNVGTIHGGSSVNAIAQKCVIEVDLRSIKQKSMEAVEQKFLEILRAVPSDGVRVEKKVIDDRPGAALPAGSPLQEIAVNSGAHLGMNIGLRASSTDATIPLSRGIPAVCFGVYRGKGAHTLEEYIELDSLAGGLKRLALALLMAAGIE